VFWGKFDITDEYFRTVDTWLVASQDPPTLVERYSGSNLPPSETVKGVLVVGGDILDSKATTVLFDVE
jgi:hypothetical protein